MNISTNTTQWHDWTGNQSFPWEADLLVKVQFRDGSYSMARRQKTLRWGWLDQCDDIVAYMVYAEEEVAS